MKMRVKDAINYLNQLPPEDQIVIAWWEMDMFYDPDPEQTRFDPPVTKTEWEDVVHIGDDMDWSMTHESLLSVMDMEIEDNRKRESNETN
tara:strand:+ start:13857 stop:14126 length:270 start_codon:yes stop_codon:yes gene_type:complete